MLVGLPEIIPVEDRDPHLGERLRLEADGILDWIIEGAMAWRSDGLQAPESVLAATEEYRLDQDWLSRFCADMGFILTSDHDDQVVARELRERYVDWCRQTDEAIRSTSDVASELEARGCVAGRSSKERFWKGIRHAP